MDMKTSMPPSQVIAKLLRIWDYLDSLPFEDDGERSDISDAAAFVEDAVNEVAGYAYF
jgi:hypothetical protein